MKVVGVAEDDLGTEVPHLVRVKHLHGRLRPDRHEGRRSQLTVRGMENSRARSAVGGLDCEAHRINIASPKE
jgi:hypothetical protein